MTANHDTTTHDPNANRTRDGAAETSSRDSFPASDPPGTLASNGARAVSPGELMRDEEGPPSGGQTVHVTSRFDDQEKAKLAVETLVREAPIDRHHAEVLPADDKVVVRVATAPADASRIGDLLKRSGGKD